jgi:hypothetical protein
VSVDKSAPDVNKVGASRKDRTILGLRDEVSRLKREIQENHRRELAEDEIRSILGNMSSTPANPPNWLIRVQAKRGGRTPEVPMTAWADWHAGESVSRSELNGVNEFSLYILESRVRRLVERTIALATEHGPGVYPGIVVNLLGDFVSGGLHPELLRTDEEEIIPAVLRVRDLLVWALRKVADAFGQVYAPAVAGNHGRGTAKPEFKRYVYKNFDWMIYQLVIRALKDLKDDRITVDVRPSNETHYRVFDQRYMAMHGDMLGVRGGDGIIGAIGPIVRGEIKTRGYAASSGQDYDMLVIGHWHQPLWLPRAIVSNTLKGYCEYAKNALRAPISEPSQPLWFVHPKYKITSRFEIKVEDLPTKKATPWVSVFENDL